MDIKNLITAAKYVHYDGVEGFRSAERLVGTDIATALLVMQQLGTINAGLYPILPETESRIEETLKEFGILVKT